MGTEWAVVTRELEDGSPYVSTLAAAGLVAIAMQVTRTAPPPDPGALARALDHTYYAVVVASVRAAHALAAAHAANPLHPLPPVWAVGRATERALGEAGIAAHHPAAVANAETLALALIAGGAFHGKRVLVPRAEEGRDEAMVLLRGAGAIVEDVIAYRTVAVGADEPAIARGREVLVAGDAAVCVVFAPSQVRALEGLLPPPFAQVRTRFVAIGETTAAALRAAGIAEVAVAPSPTPEGIAAAIAAVQSAAP